MTTATPLPPAPAAHTPFGVVHGIDHRGVAVFKAIPYATAARFEPPVPVEGWAEPLQADTYGPQCPQLPDLIERALGQGSLPSGENCLSLNVFTPGCDGAARPVLVWIHGGAFVTGNGAMPWYHGAALAARGDVVVVTINYRLGVFGFAGTANLGLRDQLTALRWVASAIGSFGGDPGNVTVFGESAGGASVLALCATPEADHLFRRAWAMSPSITQLRTADRADAALAMYLDLAGVDTLAELAGADLDVVIGAQAALRSADSDGWFTAFTPTVDGDLVPRPFATAIAADPRPLVIGTTRDEMSLFNAFDERMAALDEDGARRRFAARFGDLSDDAFAQYRRLRPGVTPGELVSAMQTDETFRAPAWRLIDDRRTGPGATWMYWFTWATPAFGGRLGSCHGLDIPFAFHNLSRPGVELFTGTGDDRVAVADAFSDALLRFARSGEPGWARHDERLTTWRVDVEPTTVDDPEPELRRLWTATG